MKRRDFIKYLLATPIATKLDIEKLLWIQEKTIFVLPQIQSVRFYGIPYHEYNASSGQWLGFSRGEHLYKEIIDLITMIQRHDVGFKE